MIAGWKSAHDEYLSAIGYEWIPWVAFDEYVLVHQICIVSNTTLAGSMELTRVVINEVNR